MKVTDGGPCRGGGIPSDLSPHLLNVYIMPSATYIDGALFISCSSCCRDKTPDKVTHGGKGFIFGSQFEGAMYHDMHCSRNSKRLVTLA